MGTHYDGSAGEVQALDAFIKLVRAAETVSAKVHRVSRTGLTISQFGVLEALYHLGPLCQIDIGAKLLKSGGNVTMVIDNLEKRGLAVRRRDETDRRRVYVHLTPEGTHLIERVFPRHVSTIVDAFSALTSDEQAELARLCRKLGRSASDAAEERAGAKRAAVGDAAPARRYSP